jgi:hypothetical protein
MQSHVRDLALSSETPNLTDLGAMISWAVIDA